jgi:hypothetical protein
VHLVVGVRRNSRRRRRDGCAHARRFCRYGQAVKLVLVDVAVKCRISFHQVAGFLVDRNGCCFNHGLQGYVHVDGHHRTQSHILGIRRETFRRNREVVGIEGNFGNLNCPMVSVCTLRSSPLTGLWILTVAPTTTAPVAAEIVPFNVVELPTDCAPISPAATQAASRTTAVTHQTHVTGTNLKCI